MKYKYIFSDIDGTLLNADRTLSPSTIQQVKQWNQIVPFMLVSARMPAQMQAFREALEINSHPLIAYNGALVLHRDEIWHSTEIPWEVLEYLVEINEKMSVPVHLSFYHKDEWYAPAYDYWAQREHNNTGVMPEILSNREVLSKWQKEEKGAHKVMCMGAVSSIEFLAGQLRLSHESLLHLYRSKDTYIEIAHREVSKLTGIKTVLSRWKESGSLEEVIAFGDNYNDVEMLGAVGLGVAVANAREEALRVAKKITAHHKEDGVARFLEHLYNHSYH